MRDRVAGCLYGMAFGDALGRETEFLDYEGIRHRFPPNGPSEPAGEQFRVTDDTQMALAVAEALTHAPFPYAPDSLGESLKEAFIDWYNTVENDRAPGNTTLESIEHLIEGQGWIDATDISSKGAGANMRVQAVGLLDVDPKTRAQIAQFQAALTHGHPTGMAAADVTAFTIAQLLAGFSPFDLLYRVRSYAESQEHIYHQAWLGDLWMRAYMMQTPEEYIAHGWGEVLSALDRLERALRNRDEEADPCEIIGGGWVAEEAYAVALLCFLLFPDDPVQVIRRAAFSSGDSDTIACIAGAFAGAYHGIDAWPSDWKDRIEYADRIEALIPFYEAG